MIEPSAAPPPPPPAEGGRPLTAQRVTALLLAVLLAVNAVAVWAILEGRREAERLAREELELETRAHAGALEAALATLRGDFIFLSYSPPLSRTPEALTSDDPVRLRWSRLAIEASVILFLEAHPSVQRLRVVDPEGRPVVVAGWRQSMPVLLRRGALAADLPGAERMVRVSWPLGPADPAEAGAAVTDAAVTGDEADDDPGGRARIEALLDPEDLAARVAPGLGERLAVDTSGADAGSGPEDDRFVVRAPVVDDGWRPPVEWTLVRREDDRALVRSVEDLAASFRTTVLINVAIITLSLVLGLVALRQVRRAGRAEAESRHQARVRELERQVRHAERLSSLGRLSAGVAHEINNPLEGMANYLRLLEEDLEAGDVASARELAGRLDQGLDRVATIVHQVLAFGDPGRAPKEPVDLAAVVASTLEFARSRPGLESTRIVAPDAAGPVWVHGNPTTLGQLVLNLVVNAHQAQALEGDGAGEPSERSGDDGARTGASVIEVDLARQPSGDPDDPGPTPGAGPRVELSVADRGPGFSADALEHLFEPFYSSRGSTGLGLSVCHGIASEHGGSIRATNRPGGGARVVVTLPALDVPPRPDSPSAGDPR